MREALNSVALILQISAVLLTSSLLCFVTGLWADRRWGTLPCGILLSTTLGILVAMVSVYRLASRARD